ncbi:hypothetical protein LTR62_006517 [Meristemomyces frigidus]|uniref:Uncharacterized protein n=1 Tax=Meristemomyces frigidus TaxID=1508187 RepID=A0AAN7TCP1_9PEZI|nr:hypothetical protein LTR62_006517 [Meristemomyces frigidus]
MNINDLPREIISDILLLATQLNEHAGETFTYGLTTHLPQHKPQPSKYVRGPLSAECLRWDSTRSLRQVCSQWHDWALSYNFEHVFERNWQGSERWAELTLKRPKYSIYELIDKHSGFKVYRDPHGSLKLTNRLFNDMPSTASHVRRLWFNGLYEAETDKLILSIVAKCIRLEYLSVPWTLLRRATAKDWVNLLNTNTGRGKPLHSLEITAVCLPSLQAQALEADTTPNPLKDSRVDFSALKRLKIFGNTLHKPVSDADLHLIARTATNLSCLDVTNLSTTTVAGILALVKASRPTLQVLEHSPRSSDGFYHPFPGQLASTEHICSLLSHLPQMRDLSISVPRICPTLFANHDVKWTGDLQVRTTDLCPCSHTTTNNNNNNSTTTSSSDNPATRAERLRALFTAARDLITARHRLHHPLSAQIFYGGCIFEPAKRVVHGDFALAEISSGGFWPGGEGKRASTLGPYGQTGTYGKEEGTWEVVGEEEWLFAVERGWVGV